MYADTESPLFRSAHGHHLPVNLSQDDGKAFYDQQLGNPQVDRDVQSIWRKINQDKNRPSKVRNSYENMVWWLNEELASLNFRLEKTNDETLAQQRVIRSIDANSPVLISTNHARTSGHIILVIGYEPLTTTKGPLFVCHDPYGQFDPSLASKLYGKRRFEGGYSEGRGEHGPGKAVHYGISGIRRIRADRHSTGTFYFVSATLSIPRR